MEDAKISKIVIDIGKKSVEMTPQQAQQLFNALEKMFGEKVVERHIHHDDFWYWRRPQPYWLSTSNGLASDHVSMSYNADSGALCCAVK